LVSKPEPTWGCGPSRRSRQDAVGGDIGSRLAGMRLGCQACPCRQQRHPLAQRRLPAQLARGLGSMNGLVPQSLPTEERKVAGSIPAGHASMRSTHPFVILIGRSPWRPTIARDAGGRWSVPASPRPGNGHVKPSGGPVIRPPPTSHATPVPSVRTGGVGIHPQSNAGLWRVCIWCCRV
jgi:hypothetical protein